MKFSIGIVIFFLALIALVAEVILYFIFGIGAAFSGGAESIGGIAAFFVWLMIVTIVAGVAAPVCGFIENASKKPNLGMYIFLPVVGLTAVGFGALLLVGHSMRLTNRANSTNSSTTTSANANTGWQVHEDTSPMDGSKTVVLQLAANNEIQGFLKSTRPSLFVRCKEGKTDVYANVGVPASVEYGLFNEHTIRIRLDDQKASSQRWGSSTDNEALFARNGAAFADQIAKTKTMLFEFTPFNGSPTTIEFNVSGLDQHLPKVKDACANRRK